MLWCRRRRKDVRLRLSAHWVCEARESLTCHSRWRSRAVFIVDDPLELSFGAVFTEGEDDAGGYDRSDRDGRQSHDRRVDEGLDLREKNDVCCVRVSNVPSGGGDRRAPSPTAKAKMKYHKESRARRESKRVLPPVAL